MGKTLERIKVVLEAAPTRIMVVVGIANFVIANNADELGPDVVSWVAQGVAVLLGAVTIIRLVAPVPEGEPHRILPPTPEN